MAESGVKKQLIPVAEALRRRNTVTKYIWLPTVRPGVFIKAEEGREPGRLPKRLTSALATHTGNYLANKLAQNKLAEAQERRRMRLVKTAGRLGIRGVASFDQEASLTVVPQTQLEKWDHDKLKKLTGEAYRNVVRHRLVVTLDIPAGTSIDPDQLEKQGSQRIRRLGATLLGKRPEELLTLVSARVDRNVDESYLHEMVTDKRLTPEALEGAAVATESWSVTPSAMTSSLSRELGRIVPDEGMPPSNTP